VDGLTQQLDEAMPLVLCGPGRNRDRMLDDLRGAGHRRPMLSVATSMGGRGAANEVLRDGLAGELLAQHRMVQEVTLLEEAWVRISTNGAVAYGSEALKKAVQEGAVDRLLILADLLRDETSTCDGSPWSDLVEQITSFGGEIIQCSADHDAGEQLVGFGGAVALLRYSV
jgi:protein pelota